MPKDSLRTIEEEDDDDVNNVGLELYPIDGNGSSYSSKNKNNSNNNNNNIFSIPLFGARYPIPVHRTTSTSRYLSSQYRSARLTTWADGAEVAVLKDPYNRMQKLRFEDSYINDPIIRRSLNLYAKFLMGHRTKTTIDINKEFMSPDIQAQILEETFNEAEVDQLKTFIDKTNRRVKFHQRTYAAVLQSFVGGRSALLIETGRDDIPTDLKVTNWQKLGQVYADKDSWRFVGVDYTDRPQNEPLRAEEIIYFANEDYNIAVDSMYFGRSKIEPIADVSETNRLIDQEDIKEAARSLWAASGLIKFPPNTSPQKVKEFLDGFIPGVYNGTTKEVEIQTFNLDVRLADLINARSEGHRMVNRSIGVPGILMGFENITNRATSEIVMNVWRETDLNDQRTWLQDTLEAQWFDSLIKIKFPDVDLEEMWIKAKLEFEDITFESLKDKSDAIVPLYELGIIPKEKALKILDMDDVVEQMLAKKQEAEIQRQQELELMKAEREKTERVQMVQASLQIKHQRKEEKERLKEYKRQQKQLQEQEEQQQLLVRRQAEQREKEHRAQMEYLESKKKVLEKMQKQIDELSSSD